jgi:hypothetical protein
MLSSIWPLQFECNFFDFFKKVYKFQGAGVLNFKIHVNKKILNSLILTNLRVAFEAWVLNLL